ncbi:MAG: hypothetical protein A2176_15305 [Spirochaetes bacterium RBG_13_51_14]|nr:MAG: hypothetical protein A2176_15305 [Spirochaetes bacterium RBG_13_51_14]
MKHVFSIDSAIAYQERNWKLRKKSVDLTEKHALPFITISREYGCLGYRVGEALAKILNETYYHIPSWAVYERHLLDRLMEDMHISYELAETLTDSAKSSMADYFRIIFSSYPPEVVLYKKLVETIRILAANGHAIIVGRVGNVITRDMHKGYHVRLIASKEKRIDNIMRHLDVTKKDAKNLLSTKGEVREQFVLSRLRVDMNDPSLYSLVINTTDLDIDQTARFIVKGMELSGIIKPRR